MDCIKYSEEDLFKFAFNNCKNIELLKILIRDFGLDVNWRSKGFYDTLLYQALKVSAESAKFLISYGACINASLGGYPNNENSHGYLSILDVASNFQSIKKLGGAKWLKQFGAVSFENIPEDVKEQVISTIDFTKQARGDKYIYRTLDQLRLTLQMVPEDLKEQLKCLLFDCELCTIKDLEKENKR